MKIDGNQQTFDYHSDLWLNKKTFQPNNLDLDDKETKLASYWTLPFTELGLGMKVDGTAKWITFSYTVSSLYSLIADGQYRSMSLDERETQNEVVEVLYALSGNVLCDVQNLDMKCNLQQTLFELSLKENLDISKGE
ncbi:uncharacterized skeletal organic matrix protein 5-like [Corticium candelabrum]|uniref:uncharacterized skeletal organic matrix protein 5-like n=1 Tax=Corticium candelabrum TaxID=121492 RepID=UPI002E25E061|nr:uncharacterized skeletal organic matrix protein 5-like [Corticium candelabrum]